MPCLNKAFDQRLLTRVSQNPKVPQKSPNTRTNKISWCTFDFFIQFRIRNVIKRNVNNIFFVSVTI